MAARARSVSQRVDAPRPPATRGAASDFLVGGSADEGSLLGVASHAVAFSPPRKIAKKTEALRDSTPPPRPRYELVCRGPPPIQSFGNESPLRSALYRNDTNRVRQILQEDGTLGALPFFDDDFEPPLCCAARRGCCQEIVDLLLAHGANWNDEDKYGRSAKELAAIQAAPPTIHSVLPGPFGMYLDLDAFDNDPPPLNLVGRVGQ
eukprot:TRINITY_DN8046_c0_g1_i1.p2 TRINITY_DN8046_c0_g1~~TRINITY_DN8046_c0_g1_i1.p2  ORF type:complete len:220 (-),score=26.94 TRINITY_DN8046_c0_g1_i1:176-793(-)